jgi:hypothetical protein
MIAAGKPPKNNDWKQRYKDPQVSVIIQPTIPAHDWSVFDD